MNTLSAWFDGHLDLACLAVEGRDLMAPLEQASGGPQPAGITFGSLREGRVHWCMGTVFTAADFLAPFGYPRVDDREGAHQAALKQLRFYKMWEQIGLIQIVRSGEALQCEPTRTPQIILLMEGGDPIRDPEEVAWWYEQGLRVVGLTWALGSRYAGGNQKGGPLSERGRACIECIDALGMIHDLSHLSDQAAWDLLALTDGPVIASHSNSRNLLQSAEQRNLSDELIQEIGRRDGVIGLNLLSRFITKHKRPASVEEALDHVEWICALAGRQDAVGLGSDLDGGYGVDHFVEGIDQPRDFVRLSEGLQARGWSGEAIRGFMRDNWLRFFRRHLPTSEPKCE